MPVLKQSTVYPYAEMFEVLAEGTTLIDLMSIRDGQIIEQVFVHIKTPSVGACNVIVGDDDDDDGFIAAADGTAPADTIYGDGVTERGAYLYDATSKAGHRKFYQVATKEIKFKLSANPATSNGTYNVIVLGHQNGS